jgi:tetratricopeptide (TPR) repeat protein
METITLQCHEKDMPQVRPWIKQVCEDLHRGQAHDCIWSCGQAEQIQVGDRIFLQRIGKPPIGYFASGYVLEAPPTDQLRQRDPAYRSLSAAYHEQSEVPTDYRICLQLDAILNFDQPLKLKTLQQLSRFQGCNFARLGQGTAFDPAYTDFLEDEWRNHSTEIARLGRGSRLIDTYCTQGAELVRNKRFEDAYHLYSEALLIDADCIQAMIGLGNVLMGQGQLAAAILEYSDAIFVGAKFGGKFDKLAYFKRGLAYFRQEELDLAIQDYRQAVELDAKYFEAHCALANTLYKAQQYSEAIDSYSRAIALAGHKSKLYLRRGKAQLKLSQLKRAKRDFEQALTLNSDLKDKVNALLADYANNNRAWAGQEKAGQGAIAQKFVYTPTPTNRILRVYSGS